MSEDGFNILDIDICSKVLIPIYVICSQCFYNEDIPKFTKNTNLPIYQIYQDKLNHVG